MNSVFKHVRFFEETNPDGQMIVNFKFWNEIYRSLNRKQKEEFFLRYNDFRKKGFPTNDAQALAMMNLTHAYAIMNNMKYNQPK